MPSTKNQQQLLTLLLANGVCVWLDRGQLHVKYLHEGLISDTVRNLMMLVQARNKVTETIRYQYHCPKCLSRDVVFSTRRRKFVCRNCKRAIAEPHRSLSSESEGLKQLGRVLRYPEIRAGDEVLVRAGKKEWEDLCTRPLTLPVRARVRCAVQQILNTHIPGWQRWQMHRCRCQRSDTVHVLLDNRLVCAHCLLTNRKNRR